ncbi:glycogenin-1-like isoform X2 [Mizuhopecten yessoensis]|uniref:glycogenin-1-like isoform X2 n=1 Tax=Mizuhopecten yessoensis TaxID=6573 RepID=UPI000B4583C0|nr:glycogenin-1-like isoform X2 [Mizuhopecten yessoensis]
MAERGEKGAFVTLATNDTYALGCLVLGNSLRRVKTVHQLVVMITDGVSSSMRNQLRRVFDLLYEVNLLDSKDPDNLQLLGRPDLNVTFTKFHCWRLTMFEKAVFLDADTLVLKNVDELFEREELSAAPDAGWPDCFNSGVFVFRPSDETYKKLLDFAVAKGSFDGGDQGLLNIYFRDWATKDIARHLPFIYNVVSQAFYSYLPAFTQFKQDVKIVHFIGATKPWHHPYNTSTKTVQPLPDSGHNQEFLQLWWDIFMSQVQPALDPSVNLAIQFIGQAANGHTYYITQAPGPTTVQSVYPFVPPNVDVHYTQQDAGHTTDSQVVDIDIVPRQYSLPETHFAENPMSVVNPDTPPPGSYDISQVMKAWGDSNTDKQNSETSNDKTELPALEQSGHIPETHNTGDETGGLVANLAAMTIQTDPSEGADAGHSEQEDVSDQERKLNWEKGQMDYLGADAFENIQKKLDETLQGPVSEATPSTSPFSTKSKTSGKD